MTIAIETPTTRDPAARLRACIERVGIATAGDAVAHQRADGSVYVSIGDYRTGPHAQGDVHLPHVDVAAMTACLNWCRDDAPALLAEVQKLRAARDVGADLDNEDRRNDPDFWWNVAAFRGVELSRQIDEREAAEQVARDQADELRVLREYIAANDRLDTFLAHHGARTGDAK